MLTVFIQSKGVGFIFQASSTHSTQVICGVGWRERNKELGNQQQPTKAWIQNEWVELKYQALLEIVSLPPYVCFYHDCFITAFLQANSTSWSKLNSSVRAMHTGALGRLVFSVSTDAVQYRHWYVLTALPLQLSTNLSARHGKSSTDLESCSINQVLILLI